MTKEQLIEKFDKGELAFIGDATQANWLILPNGFTFKADEMVRWGNIFIGVNAFNK